MGADRRLAGTLIDKYLNEMLHHRAVTALSAEIELTGSNPM